MWAEYSLIFLINVEESFLIKEHSQKEVMFNSAYSYRETGLLCNCKEHIRKVSHGGNFVKRNLSFFIPIYTEDSSIIAKPVKGNYDYWIPLLEYFLKKSNFIEIHCWNEEMEIIEQIKSLHKNELEVNQKENITIFKGRKSSILSDYLLNNYQNKIGEFKWFTVNLENGTEHVFHSGHWGTEFFVPNVMEEEIAFIKGITPIETSFYQY